MGKASEFDSQLQVLNVVSLLIDRLPNKIIPSAEKLLSFLAQVWKRSEGQSLLRIQVILALQRLLAALGSHCPMCYDLLFPILRYSTDITQPDELNMLEDGMQLWLTTLRHAPAMVPPLLHLFPNLIPIMERNFDHMMVAMKLLESYILIGGSEFLGHHGQSAVKLLDSVIGNVKEKGLMVALNVIDTLIQCFPQEAPPVLEQVLQKLLLIAVAGSESDLVRATCAALLARVLLQNAAAFGQLLTRPLPAAALTLQRSPKPLLIIFLDVWLDKLDSLSSVAKRKLSALGLCMVVTLPEPQVLDRLEQIVSACTGVLHETEGTSEHSNGSAQGYDYWAADAGDDDSTEVSGSESLRRKHVFSIDPVNTLSVAHLLKQQLQSCAAVHGEAAVKAATEKVHPSVLAQLQRAIS
eukprot:TRINITY_DN6200_c0_g1_i2.p1 TRINITY_DN6200_c0_g1~~TRINITY_DN6200_c0_g1_i2.p1  ORF type:complete len:451 (-),score=102.92 TRINITY_DN6200_c0_g1_i2:173-1402(-)